MTQRWTEIGDRVFVRRYQFYDQNIVAVLGRSETLVVDTRTTPAQAQEILDDLRDLGAPPVGTVVNTHGHHDHAFGNSVFRPAAIWAHERCVGMLERTGERQRRGIAREIPAIADELAEVVIDLPDRTFSLGATLDVGGRRVDLQYLGRGHTDNDIVVLVPDASILIAGDLLENGAVPYFGDGFPMDWPETAQRLLALTDETTVVVPGHGDHADRTFAASQMVALRQLATLAEQVHAGALELEAALTGGPWSPEATRAPLQRALVQLRGELDD